MKKWRATKTKMQFGPVNNSLSAELSQQSADKSVMVGLYRRKQPLNDPPPDIVSLPDEV